MIPPVPVIIPETVLVPTVLLPVVKVPDPRLKVVPALLEKPATVWS